MGKYYIKKHYKTDEEYPAVEGIHFTGRAAGVAKRFSACDGFLLYEAGQRDSKSPRGVKCVYGYGKVAGEPQELSQPRVVNGKEYPLVVPVEITKRLQDKEQGIPLVILKEQFGIQMRPTLGGVMEISKEVFDVLKEMLDDVEQ